MDSWYPIFVASGGKWVFVCWCPWISIRDFIVKRLRARGWNTIALYQGDNPNFGRDPYHPPFRAPLGTDWWVVFWRYVDTGQFQTMGYCGSQGMAQWLAGQLGASAQANQVQGVDNPDSLRTGGYH